jgi:integrase
MSILRRLIFPAIGNYDIQKITAPEILMPLRSIEARGLNDTANTALQLCGQIFRYAIASGYTAGNPASDLRGALAPVIVRHNAALTDPRKIADLVRAMQSYMELGSVVVHHALWFSAYTFLRPGEVRRLEWQEVNFDTTEIRIPPEKMKMRRLHVVPLSSQVIGILEKLSQITGNEKYVFPSVRGDGRPMSEATITAALRRMGFSSDEMSAHGFRSMATTTLYEQGCWIPDAIERQLAHVEGNSIKAAYNYAEHLPERRKMMQSWADWLDSLIS